MTGATQAKILLIEDDELAGNLLRRYLEKQGFIVEVETQGDRASGRIMAMQPDAVVLDGMLPGKDGFEVCREARAQYSGPILMLTARDDDVDQVLGLELGADDYIVKPAEPRVVLAHIRACLRRASPRPVAAGGESEEYRFGKFHISRTERTVRLDAVEITFSTAEFDLLWLLASRAGEILSRDDIQSHLRGIEHDGLDRAIDMRISRLRKRLGDDAVNPARIKTVRGKGYLFSRTDWN